jgi:hypothetical protein
MPVSATMPDRPPLPLVRLSGVPSDTLVPSQAVECGPGGIVRRHHGSGAQAAARRFVT